VTIAKAAEWDAKALPADLFAGRVDAKLVEGTLVARRGDEVITAT